MFSENITYPTVTRLYGYGDTFEICEGKVGGHSKRVHGEGGICADGDESEVFNIKCPEKGNAKDFLRGLRLKKEELVQVGVTISDQDYLSTIISSLPDALSNFASMQMSWTLQQTQQSMDANTLMTMLLQEAECQDLRSQWHKQMTGKAKEDEKSEALAVSTEKPRGKRDLSKIECWNCGKMGHFSLKCEEPKKSKEQKSPVKSDSQKEGTSAAAVDSSSDDERAWAAEEIEDSRVVDWFEEVVDEKWRLLVVMLRGQIGLMKLLMQRIRKY